MQVARVFMAGGGGGGGAGRDGMAVYRLDRQGE